MYQNNETWSKTCTIYCNADNPDCVNGICGFNGECLCKNNNNEGYWSGNRCDHVSDYPATGENAAEHIAMIEK